MKKNRGLGKGLEALISQNVLTEDESVDKNDIKGVQEIDINMIEPNEDQPRKIFDEDSIIELSDSIEKYGIIQPLLIKKNDDFYSIIAGERRWRAAKKVGLKKVPVIIKEYNDQKTLEISLIENIQREDLNPIEEAKAYKKLIDEFSLKQENIAAIVSKSRSAITNSMRLLNLSEKVQTMIIENIISSGHARALLAINNKKLQYEIALKIIDENLSVRETEKLIKKLKNKKTKQEMQKTEDNLAPIYHEIEDRMKEIMGTKVQIIRGKKKSKIEIEYYSDDDLDRIMEIFESAN